MESCESWTGFVDAHSVKSKPVEATFAKATFAQTGLATVVLGKSQLTKAKLANAKHAKPKCAEVTLVKGLTLRQAKLRRLYVLHIAEARSAKATIHQLGFCWDTV